MHVRIKGARRFRVQGAYYPPRMTSGRVKKERTRQLLVWVELTSRLKGGKVLTQLQRFPTMSLF